jgi:two-component system response regulator FixJ
MPGRGLRLPVVVVTAHGDVPLAVQAMKAGACDFIEKPCGGAELIGAAEAALARGDENLAREREAAQAAARVAALTRREAEVLAGLVAGQQNKVIAIELGLSHRTVEIHRANVMTRLGARSLSEAVRIAMLAGVAPPASRG